ncbi:MAG TPA: rhodanese-like domain-containing protein [Bryobacteraceae bacterium]|nr:rhodanese-like domain-containing protein [Bryobacteraceae bacterium]
MQELPVEVTPREVRQRMDAGEPVRLIDVREPFEYAITRIEGAELIPMRSVPTRLQHLDAAAREATLIVFCHHGVRSLDVTYWLREQGVAACQSMTGGIERWSLEVDATVPRY